MRKSILGIIVLLILIAVMGTALFLQYRDRAMTPEPEESEQVTPIETPLKKPIIHYPVPESHLDDAQDDESVTSATPKKNELPLPQRLPEVDESDESIDQALTHLFKGQPLYKLLYIDFFIQKIVATIDNLPGRQLPRIHMPIKAPGGPFAVSGSTDNLTISPSNATRYLPYIELLESLDVDQSILLYVHFYPLFQQAYEQLGYQNAYFNDRLVFVLDHLLEVPDVNDQQRLIQPSVLYQFADPLLEQRSCGQKILLRSGRENRNRVLAVLKQYRQRLTSLNL